MLLVTKRYKYTWTYASNLLCNVYIVTGSVLNYLSLRYMLICYILVITKFSVLLVKAENTKKLFFFTKVTPFKGPS